MKKMNELRYTFGTSDTAAARLETIARFFNTPAAAFIEKFTRTPVKTAADLGCGPGFTTHMLSIATHAFKTYGFDKSDYFIDLASEKYPDCTFIQHDVTQFPFPVQPDIMYCRSLLSHLTNVVQLINYWINELNDGGILFLDELENIYSNIDVFEKYIHISEGLIASQNASLFVGKLLAEGKYHGQVLANEYIYLPVKNSQAAEWFYPNTISIWEKEKFVMDNINAEERIKISSQILDIKESHDQNSDITWKMRRLAIRK